MTLPEPESKPLDQLISDLRKIDAYDRAHAARDDYTHFDVTGCGDDYLLHYKIGQQPTSLLLPKADAREFVRGTHPANACDAHAQLHETLKRWLAMDDARGRGDRKQPS